MTDISLNKNIKNLFSGEFFQKKSVLSDSDVAALTKYNSEIERGVSKNIAFHKTMKDTSVAAQNMAKSAKGAAVNISEIPKQSEAAEVGLKALSIAGNMLVSMGVAWGISKIIEGIEWLATSSERAKETAESLSSELKTQDENISGNIATLKGLEGEFNSLSKGVDDYGANISLSAGEYARYQEIVQQIVGISPSLISGYDKEGKAIANKNGLIERSMALLKEENRQKIENATSKDTIKTLGKGEVEKYKDVEVEVQNERRNNSFWVSGNYLQVENKNKKLLELIGINDKKPWWLNDNSFYGDKLRANYDILFQNFDKIIEYNNKLKSMKQPTLLDDEEITRLTKWADTYGKTEAKLEKASKSLNPTLQIVPQSLTVYDELSDKQKDFISEYVNTFRISANTTEADIEKMRQDILNFTEAIGNASPETKKAIEDLFTLDKTKLSAGDFEKQANELINQIVNSLEFDNEDDKNEFVKNLKIKLGFEFTTDGKTTTETMQNDIKAKLQDEFDDMVNDMSIDELKVAAKIVADIPEGTIISWDELQEKMKEAAAAAKETAVSLKFVSDAKKGLDSLFDSYEKDMELTADEVSEILQENPQYIQYLTKVGDTYKVNQKALEDWKKVQEEQQRLVDIQMGSNVYATQYNPTLDGVSDISTKDYTGTGNWESGKQALNELIAKNKELNQSFADGKISAAEYFTSLSDSITNSGLEQALDDIGGKFDETTDYIEGTISVLASELSDALIQANKRYTSGKTSVGDYADELMASIEVQKKLLKST